MEITELVETRRLPSPDYRRALRQEAQLSLSDLANKLDVCRSTVSRWERGLREPSGANRVAYRKLLSELKQVVADV